jgi:uncharacterized protein (TIGR02246 family)
MNTALFRYVFTSFVCFATVGLVQTAVQAAVRDEILQIVEKYDAALKTRDKAFLQDLYEDEGQFVKHDGRHLDKQGYIAEALGRVLTESKSSKQTIRSLTDTVAVETGTFLAVGTRDGKPIKEHLSYTTVWVKRDGKWRIAAEQGTPITQAAISSEVTASAQSAAQPKPGPEHEHLEVWVGDWNYEGVGQESPFYPTRRREQVCRQANQSHGPRRFLPGKSLGRQGREWLHRTGNHDYGLRPQNKNVCRLRLRKRRHRGRHRLHHGHGQLVDKPLVSYRPRWKGLQSEVPLDFFSEWANGREHAGILA